MVGGKAIEEPIAEKTDRLSSNDKEHQEGRSKRSGGIEFPQVGIRFPLAGVLGLFGVRNDPGHGPAQGHEA